MTLKWTAKIPRKAGWYWTRVLDEKRTIICLREVTKSDEHGMSIRTDPTAPEMSMNLAFWAATWKTWFAGPIDAPPEV